MSDSSAYIPIGYSYAELYDKILEQLKSKSEWTNISEDDTLLKLFITILTAKEMGLFASINNTFIDYFPNISSAEELVYLFADYIKMDFDKMLSATCTMRFSLASAHTKNIIFPAEIEVTVQDNSIIYSTLISDTMYAGDTYIDISAVQGQWKEVENVADGTASQKYYLYEDNDVERMIVYVDDVEWTKVSNFFYSTNVDNHYMVKIINGGLYVLFGDGKFGVKPPTGSIVKIKYLKSLGLDGNLYSINLIKTIMSTIYDSDDVDVTELLTVTNTTTATDGYDGDTVDEIKKSIPTFFTTNPYIIRKDEYRDYILTHPLVRDVKVYAGWEVYPDTYQNWFTGIIYVVPKTTDNLTEEEKTEIYDFIKLKDTFFTDFDFLDVVYIGNFLEISLKFVELNPTQVTINRVKDEIVEIITNYYDKEYAVDNYGTVFRDIYRSVLEKQILDGVEELMKINITFYSVENAGTMIEDSTTYNTFLDYKDIKENETYLYIGTEKVGTYEDGSTTWTLVPQDNTSEGGINWIGKITSTILQSTKVLDIVILDSNLVDSDNPNNIIGDTIYIRSNSLDDNDIYQDASGNMIFEYFDHEFIDLGL